MSKIRQLIDEISINNEAGVNSIENSRLITTNRLSIKEDKALLPSQSIGDIVFNIGFIFDNSKDDVFMEGTCRSSTDGLYVEFDKEDNLNGKYCVVSYLGSINE